MKCPKCGFESDRKFCPECGAPLQTTAAPQPQAPNPRPIPPQRPLQPVQSTARLVQAPPRTNKAAFITVACVVGAVVLTGITAAILSGVFYHKNLISATASSQANDQPTFIEYDDYDDYEDSSEVYSFSDDGLYFWDFMTRDIGNFSDFKRGRIALTDIDKNGGEYTFTVTLENNTDKEQAYRLDEVSLVHEADAADTRFTSLYKPTRDAKPYDGMTFKLASGDKTVYTCVFKGPEDDVDLELYVNFNYFDENSRMGTGNVKYDAPAGAFSGR